VVRRMFAMPGASNLGKESLLSTTDHTSTSVSRSDHRRDRRCPSVPVKTRLRPTQRHRAFAGLVQQQAAPPAQPNWEPTT
jgi:hypothetical protein